MDEIKLHLTPAIFGDAKKLLVESSEFKVFGFRYSTGVAGLRVENAKGGFELLPFQGQQIWRANFLGRELTMRTTFEEPVPTRDYLATYGGFLLHCGVAAMGVPGPGDDHPLHGELPNIPYSAVCVTGGTDAEGDYIAVGGSVHLRTGFERDYIFRPEVRLRAGATVMDVSVELENLRSTPMQFMYLCHINYRPLEGGALVYSAKPDPAHVKVYKAIPEGMPKQQQDALRAYMEAIEKNPSVHHKIDAAGQIYDPEIVMAVTYEADTEGWAYCMQCRGEEVDLVAFRPAQLPFGIRWISRTGDEDAMGMLLPATADHCGRTRAVQHGLMQTLAPKGRWRAAFRAGCLEAEPAEALRSHIEGMV